MQELSFTRPKVLAVCGGRRAVVQVHVAGSIAILTRSFTVPTIFTTDSVLAFRSDSSRPAASPPPPSPSVSCTEPYVSRNVTNVNPSPNFLQSATNERDG